MHERKAEVFVARVTRVLGPDFFEAVVQLGFDITLRKKFKLGGVDVDQLRSQSDDETRAATEFLRSRVEGQSVILRTTRRGDYWYTKCCYGPEETSVTEEMFQTGHLKPYKRPEANEQDTTR